jgi:hypothetical protein
MPRNFQKISYPGKRAQKCILTLWIDREKILVSSVRLCSFLVGVFMEKSRKKRKWVTFACKSDSKSSKIFSVLGRLSTEHVRIGFDREKILVSLGRLCRSVA